MSGQVNSAKEQLEKIDKILDEYEANVGIGVVKSPIEQAEIDNYLSMDRKEIESLSGESCIAIAYRLDQFAFYLQRVYNREETRVIWADSSLFKAVAHDVDNYDKYTKYEIKVNLIAKTNEFVYNLQRIHTYAQQRAKRLSDLARMITNLSNTLKSMARYKGPQYERTGN